MNKMNLSIQNLDAVAVDHKYLATNYADIVPDCTGVGAEVKTLIMDSFPLLMWLLGTSLSRRVREGVNANGLCAMHKDENGKWVMEVPRTIWTELPTSTAQECCWQPFDFAKCAGNVPVNLLCLKDCENLLDSFIGNNIRLTSGVDGVTVQGETLEQTRKRIARMSMAFLTAYNVILGIDDTFTDILKPFHGLLAVMENPAIATIEGSSILSAFDSVACRLALLGSDDEFVFAVNPLIYESIKGEIRPGQFGELPIGWSLNNDELRFNGMRFIRDRLVPVDLTSSTGEVWVLSSNSVGAYLATDLMPADAYIRSSSDTDTYANNCGSNCDYYYNLGAAFANNANKLMKIANVPVSGACAAAIADLNALIVPKTLIPNVGE